MQHVGVTAAAEFSSAVNPLFFWVFHLFHLWSTYLLSYAQGELHNLQREQMPLCGTLNKRWLFCIPLFFFIIKSQTASEDVILVLV